MQRYKLIRITDKNGEDKVEDFYPTLINKECSIDVENSIFYNSSFVVQFDSDPTNVLRTSAVQNYNVGEKLLTIMTRNSVYQFEKI